MLQWIRIEWRYVWIRCRVEWLGLKNRKAARAVQIFATRKALETCLDARHEGTKRR